MIEIPTAEETKAAYLESKAKFIEELRPSFEKYLEFREKEILEAIATMRTGVTREASILYKIPNIPKELVERHGDLAWQLGKHLEKLGYRINFGVNPHNYRIIKITLPSP